jgi:glycosyltransferase involved in cell wall biosynthesis
MGLVCPLGFVRVYTEEKGRHVKVLFFSHQGDFIYGGEVSTFAFMKELKSAGVEVHFASPEGVVAEWAAKLADKVHIVPAVQFSRSFRRLPHLLPAMRDTRGALAKVVKREKIDLVHAMSLKAMAYAALLRKVPVLWHHHDILPSGLRNRAWLHLFAARTRRILVPSEASRQALLSAGIGEGKIGVLFNGLDGNLWRPRPPRSRGGPLTVGFVGELSERKGVDQLPALLEALEKAEVSTRWKIVGGALSDPALADQLRAALAPQIASGQVEFLGRREDVRDILQGFDVLWVPSRQEPFGIVLIEAAFSGVPVVANPVGGIPEIVVAGSTGFLVKNTAETVAALKSLADASAWERFSRAARSRAEQMFDMKPLGRKLVEVYEEILK